ncbi:MAG TPA: sel1 repeat family protein [Hyphomicrobium sp.]|nr:sel1 repeat family protein [Hyphomicrobium sp.]
MARLDLSSRDMIECAAQGGQPDALLELGLIYSTGRDGAADLVEAHKWFNLAAMRGNEAAKRYRSELSREMSKADVARAQKRAREWLNRTN